MIEWPSFRNIWKFSNTSGRARESGGRRGVATTESFWAGKTALVTGGASFIGSTLTDRKSTRLNSSHGYISYAVFCLKKKKNHQINHPPNVLHNRRSTSFRVVH